MARVLKSLGRLLKLGALIGAAVGIARVVMNRRRQPQPSESSWPTIAERAAQNDQPTAEAASDNDPSSESDTESEDEASSPNS